MFNFQGLGEFASDSYGYMQNIVAFFDVLEGQNIFAYFQTPLELHLKLYALSFLLLKPLFGFTILSAEVVNLVCYVATILLVFALGNEIFNRQIGFLASFTAGVIPSFLLHTTQLYSTPLIISGILTLILVNVYWMTRSYGPLRALVNLSLGILALLMLGGLRFQWWPLYGMIIVFGFIFSVGQRRSNQHRMHWNRIAAFVLLLVMVALPGLSSPPGSLSPAFARSNGIEQHEFNPNKRSLTFDLIWDGLVDWLDYSASQVGLIREYNKDDASPAGSNVDTYYEINNLGDLLRYIPRAFVVGFYAPFPNMWYEEGAKLGFSARIVSGFETLLMYGVEIMALLGIWQARRRLSAWYLFLVASTGMTMLGLVVVNIGALYRFRYSFWILLLVLGAGGVYRVVYPGLRLFWSNFKGGVKKIILSDHTFDAPILLVANWDWVLYNFRLPLARALEEQGLSVILVCPPGRYTQKILDLGFQWQPWKLDRRSIFPWRELNSIYELQKIYRNLHPAAVHHFTIKPILYGSIAARMAGVNLVINNFTGLGYLFSDARKAAWLRIVVLPILRRALQRDGFHTAFQQEHDLSHLVSIGALSEKNTTLIPGTGVNLDRYQPQAAESARSEPPIVFMAARLLWDKGLAEFIQAARVLHDKDIAVRFWLAGAPDHGNPASVGDSDIEEWRVEGIVEILGHRNDIPELLQQADIAVLPSYHEGVPLFLLEAAASGVPIVASDIEGCRVVVDHGANGFLVPKGDANELMQALEHLLVDADLRTRMGMKSRRIAEERFDQKMIIDKYIGLYRKLSLLPAGVKTKRPILLVANWDWVLYNFRLPLARVLVDNDLDVILVCPPGNYVKKFQEMGFNWHSWDLDRRSIYPWNELNSIIDLYKIYRDLHPAAVHHFTIKPILYGSLAARAAQVDLVINNFTGLGYLFSGARKAIWLRRIVLPVLSQALNREGFHTAFQNNQDLSHLVSLGIVSKGDTTLIPGTGVNLEHYSPSRMKPDEGEAPAVIMAARLLWDKGLAEFIETAREIRRLRIPARFMLAGAPDLGNPDSVTEDDLEIWRNEGIVELLGHRSDMPDLLKQADIAVLPSNYHEGVPLFLLEAASTGLPLVASDIEGCRMVIDNGVNGYLIPQGNTQSLIDTLIPLLKDSQLRQRMGRESRKIAESRFDQQAILARYLNLYRGMKLLD